MASPPPPPPPHSLTRHLSIHPSCRGRIHAARSLASSISAFVVSTALLLRDQVGGGGGWGAAQLGDEPFVRLLPVGWLQMARTPTAGRASIALLVMRSTVCCTLLQTELDSEAGAAVRDAFEQQAEALQQELQAR